MSHEVLLVSGVAGAAPAAERRRVLAHAAGRVPGVVSWETYEDERTAVALVVTAPLGGTVGHLRASAGGVRVVVGMSDAAASAALEGTAGPLSGAEHGHVRVDVDPSGTIELGTDGTGILPSFWAGSAERFAWSTHLASLVSLGVRPDLDEVGSLEYLVMLQPLGVRTVLADASLLPAGGRLRLDPGRPPQVDVQRLYTPSTASVPDDVAVEEFRTLWTELTDDLLARASSERLALGLSGGLDSRAIAAECVRRGSRPHAFTYGAAGSDPGRVATEVARILQLDHTLLGLHDDRLMPSPAALSELLDGAHSPGEMYELWFGSTLRQFADVVVNGHGGGPLWGDEKALGITDPGLLLDTLAQRYASELEAVSPFLGAGVATGARETFRASLRSSLVEWTESGRPDMVSFWNVHNRQFRWGNMLATALRRSGLRLEAPFMDSRFLRFSAALTPEQRRNGRLYLRVHREVFAETAAVPRSDDGNPPQRLSHLYWSGESSFARQFAVLAREHPVSAVRRASGRVQGNVAHRLERTPRLAGVGERYLDRHSVFVADVWLRNREAYRTRLLDFLSGAPTPSVLSAAAVERAVDELASGATRDGALRLVRIATLQAWNQDFVRRATEVSSVR